METETAVVPEEYGKKKYAQFEKYLLLKCLGSGFHAKVKLGLDPETNQKVAIKIFKKTHSLTAVIATMKKEIEIMKALKHKNIVNMIDLVENGTYKKKNGSSYSCFAIVLEYISGGELFEYVSSTGSFKEEVARTYFIQLVKGLTYIHEQGFAHRDLKPENLLFDESYILRIADFGFSTILEGQDGSGQLTTYLGTDAYMAPEIHMRAPYSGISVDLFAAGIILFIMYAGSPPFVKAEPKDGYYKFLCTSKNEVFWTAHSRGKRPGFFSTEFQNLINSMFAFDPTQRLTASEILEHPWVKGSVTSEDAIQEEFVQRQKVVEAELERARLIQQAEKEKLSRRAPANLLHTGVGFRGPEDDVGFERSLYPNLENQRQCQSFTSSGRITDFYTVSDPESLLYTLLAEKEQIGDEITLDDNEYKLQCSFTFEMDAEFYAPEQVDFEIQFLQSSDSDLACVEFQYISGCRIEFSRQVQAIQDFIRKNDLQEVPVVG